MQKRRYQPSFFCTVFCIRFVVFVTNTCFANCSLFCFVAMHTLEKQCVARQLQSKFQRLHLPCCFVCLRLFFWHKNVFCKLFPFLFRCYAYPRKSMRKQGNCNQNFNSCICLVALPACVCFLHKKAFCTFSVFVCIAQCTTKKQGVIKVMQSKFQRDANKISILAFALLLCLLAFIFGTNTYFANCFFVWLPCGCSQLCVCKVPSDICCFYHVGTLLRRHFAFFTMHFCCFTKQQIRFSVFACVFNLSTAKNCVCSFLCF